MTSQIWLPQRFAPASIFFTLPAVIDVSNVLQNQSTTTIDLRQYMRGGRLPYKYTITGLLAPCRYAADRGIITISNVLSGQMLLTVQVADAFGSVAQAQVAIIISRGPLSVTAVYPDMHNGISYDYTPLIVGGRPPYTCLFQGFDYSSRNGLRLTFDTTTARMYGTPNIPTSLGTNVWQLFVTDSASIGPPSGSNPGVIIPATTVSTGGALNITNP